MKQPVFLDTGFLIALELSNDQHHAAATDCWRELTRSLPPLVTTSFVLDEVITFFNSRGRHAKAVEIGQRLISTPSVQVIHVDEVLFRSGLEFLARHADKRFSLTDCISFVTMREMRMHEALAFGAHFEQAGFTRLPG